MSATATSEKTPVRPKDASFIPQLYVGTFVYWRAIRICWPRGHVTGTVLRRRFTVWVRSQEEPNARKALPPSPVFIVHLAFSILNNLQHGPHSVGYIVSNVSQISNVSFFILHPLASAVFCLLTLSRSFDAYQISTSYRLHTDVFFFGFSVLCRSRFSFDTQHLEPQR